MALVNIFMGNQKSATIVREQYLIFRFFPRCIEIHVFFLLNFLKGNTYPGQMMAGMTFTIEPILSVGNTKHRILKDEWTAVTKDNSRAAQFEHTILITRGGYEILTLSDKECSKLALQANSTQL